MKQIIDIQSHLEMVGFIKTNGTACRFVSLISETPVTNIQAACPFKGVIKTSKKMGLINVNYVTSVEKRIADKLGIGPKAVEYVPGNTWYKHLEITVEVNGKEEKRALPLCINKKKDDGEFYLQYFPTSSKNVYTMPNGDVVNEADLKPWFYDSKKPDFKPVVITVKLTNIKRIALSGVIMKTEDLEEAQALLDTIS